MAEAIPYGTISNILFKLGSVAFKELGLIFKANKELEKLQETLCTINAVLLDAEQAAESSELVKNWISRLQVIVCDADDLLDEFQYEHLRQKVHSAKRYPQVHINPFASSSPLAFRLTLGRRVKSIREKLDEVAADINKFNLGKRVMIDMGVGNNTWRETDSSPKSEIIGRNQNKEDIRNLLLQPTSNQDNFSIVAVVGFGGLGKTALAQLVYNEPTIESHFSPKIWVCVSDQFDIKLLIKNILKCAGVKVGELDPQEILQKKLKDVLGGKRYLIVLDDVWNEDGLRWDNFLEYLVDGAPGSKILVTSRSKKAALAMGINSPYVLEGLNRDQSWDLFKHVVAFRGQNEINRKLELIGKEVVERCKGVPLAIKTLASLMRQNYNEDFWLSIRNNDKVWKTPLENKDGIMSVLKLSYNHLPVHLRPCFSFCSIFPKDFEIPKDKLIQLWNAQGYIQPSISNKRSLDLGDEYYKDLLSRSFFQEEKKAAPGRITCKMHDLIHDLAQLVAGSSFSTVKDVKQKIPKDVRHLSLECQPSQKFCTHLFETKGIIRTIVRFTNFYTKQEVIQIPIFSRNPLRILVLNYMDIKMLPNSIGKLKHLRFLDISDNENIEVLPDFITDLHNLQILLLSNCKNLKMLPKDISKLISLECFNVQNCYCLKYMPKGLGELTSLQRLSNFIVNNDKKEFSVSATLNELRDLNYLGGYLNIENLDMVRNVELESNEANLKEKKYLESLKLQWREIKDRNNEKDELLLDNLEPHPNLKNLVIIRYKGTRFSSWLSSLENLVSLCISNSCCSQQLPRLDHLPSLKYLCLERFSALEFVADGLPSSSLPCSTSTTTKFFPSLEELALYGCDNLKGWWRRKNKNEESTSELPCFPCLSSLVIWDCPNLTSMPLFPSLNDLILRNASIMPFQRTLTMKANKTSTASSSSRSCSTAPPLSNLKTLNLVGIDDLETLPEEFLLNLTSLELLVFDGYKLECLPPKRPHCLKFLMELVIRRSPNLTALPEWISTLTSLKTLEIKDCPQVQSLPGEMHRLTYLKELIIRKCPKLSEACKEESGIQWPQIVKIPNIFIQDRWVRGKDECRNHHRWMS